MIWVMLAFLGLSIYLYCLLGGADFGVGVHELFISKKHKRRHEDVVKEAMGPVWEANHMWLIIVVVILFVGFPKVYARVSIYMHIPLTLMLIGIILRGCAFAFRHYDAEEDQTRRYYSLTFSVSSLLTPIALGMIIGGLMSGKVPPLPAGYYETYVAPWFNLFAFSVGLFVLSIFMFLAAVFMIGERSIGIFKDKYVKRGKIFHLVMIFAGALVFAAAGLDGPDFITAFMTHPIAAGAFILATVSHVFLWRLFGTARLWPLRVLAGFQLLMIVGAWLAVIYPHALFYADGSTLSILDAAAPPKTRVMLGTALIAGSFLFLPLLFYLFFVFKGSAQKA